MLLLVVLLQALRFWHHPKLTRNRTGIFLTNFMQHENDEKARARDARQKSEDKRPKAPPIHEKKRNMHGK